MTFTVQLAEKYIQIQSITPELFDFFQDYIVEGRNPDFSISWTKEEVESEQTLCETTFSFSYLETLVALRKIADWLPSEGRLLLHGASISYENKGYLFTAPSGTGKSTHIRLWRKHLGKKVGIVNGDKPFVSLDGEIPYIYGTPWAGKEGWQRNCRAPLSGICIVQRGETNSIRMIDASEALPILFKQIYLPKTPKGLDQTLALMDVLLKKVPVYLLQCDISEEAVKCSFEALTGLPYRP